MTPLTPTIAMYLHIPPDTIYLRSVPKPNLPCSSHRMGHKIC